MSHEDDYEPAPTAVQCVKAAFVRRNKIGLLGGLAESARLLFDSYLEPAPLGVRGGFAPARHLVHESTRHVVDLQIAPLFGKTGSLAGQIAEKDEGSEVFAGTEVVLMRGQETVLRQTTANAVGEFQLEFDCEDNLTLYLDTPSSTLIAIALPDCRRRPPQQFYFGE
jgi:hypothetical protein